MKILLLGKNGQVGSALQQTLAPFGELTALDRHGDNGLCGDLTDLDGLRNTIQTLKPDLLVNAAAYTAVDQAETEREQAHLINAEAPKTLAQAMKQLGGWLVHYSTDYVFDGTGEKPWRENSPTAPVNHYGLTKLQGEQAIQASGCNHLIFRTSWVYGSNGNNFANTMLRLAKQREQLTVINDQHGVPTSADLIAEVTATAIQQQNKMSGIYHLAPAGETTWYHYACYVIEQARKAGQPLKVENIYPIATSDYPTPAKRPPNSRLDTKKLCSTFDIALPDWKQGVNQWLDQWLGENQ